MKGQQEEELTFLKQQLLVGSPGHSVLSHIKVKTVENFSVLHNIHFGGGAINCDSKYCCLINFTAVILGWPVYQCSM